MQHRSTKLGTQCTHTCSCTNVGHNPGHTMAAFLSLQPLLPSSEAVSPLNLVNFIVTCVHWIRNFVHVPVDGEEREVATLCCSNVLSFVEKGTTLLASNGRTVIKLCTPRRINTLQFRASLARYAGGNSASSNL